MKKVIFIIVAISILKQSFAQSSVTGHTWAAGRYIGWSTNNSLELKTSFINRMKLNGNATYATNTYSTARNGYLLLGTDVWPNTNLYSTFGAFSQLHLSGLNGTFVQEAGYRPWMQTGVTFTDNQDLSYFGLRQVGTEYDYTETVIGWADNVPGTNGPDNVSFRFFGEGNGSTTISTTDLQTHNDLDG